MKKTKRKKLKKIWLFIICLVLFITPVIYYYTVSKDDKDTKKDNTKTKQVEKKNEDIEKETDVKPVDNTKTDNDKKEEKTTPKNDTKPKEQKENNNTPKTSKTYPKLDERDGEKVSLGTSSKGYEIYTKGGIAYVDGIMIVNKSYPLPSDYYPINTHANANGVTKVCNSCISETAYQAFNTMKADAAALGLNIWIQSGYRPYSSQEKIYNSYVARDGKEKADTYSARPGHSEHQSGLCFDLNSISDAFTNTNEGKWVNSHAHLYGFIIRFPKGKQNYTGYKYESWHLRYVGSDLAEKLYNNGNWISLEEYYGLSSEYKD